MIEAAAITANHARWENSPGRQLAYRTWAADPSVSVAQLVRQLDATHGLKLAERTVRDWRERDQWEKRRALERLADSEVSIPQMIVGLRVAAPMAVAYVRAVMDGREEPNALRLRAADLLIRENRAFTELLKDQLMQPLPEAAPLSDADLLALETPWVPEDQGSETPE